MPLRLGLMRGWTIGAKIGWRQNWLAPKQVGAKIGPQRQNRLAPKKVGAKIGWRQNRLGAKIGWRKNRLASKQVGAKIGWRQNRLAPKQVSAKIGWRQNRLAPFNVQVERMFKLNFRKPLKSLFGSTRCQLFVFKYFSSMNAVSLLIYCFLQNVFSSIIIQSPFDSF